MRVFSTWDVCRASECEAIRCRVPTPFTALDSLTFAVSFFLYP